jgi:acetoin utilization protein AcuB
MTRPVAIAAPETRVSEALERMQMYGIRQLPVVEHDRLVGLVTESDVREALGLQLSPHQTKERLDWAVFRLMNEQVPVLAPETPLADAVELLIQSKAGAVPVVTREDGKLIGILSVIDVLRAVRPLL